MTWIEMVVSEVIGIPPVLIFFWRFFDHHPAIVVPKPRETVVPILFFWDDLHRGVKKTA